MCPPPGTSRAGQAGRRVRLDPSAGGAAAARPSGRRLPQGQAGVRGGRYRVVAGAFLAGFFGAVAFGFLAGLAGAFLATFLGSTFLAWAGGGGGGS